MTFGEQLNEYISRLGCTAKELSDESGLSGAVISRYRKGERIPDKSSEQLEKLAAGIESISAKKGLNLIKKDDILSEFAATLKSDSTDCSIISANLNGLISVLEISITELARTLNYDASYLSRIRSGQRKPANPEAFVDGVCRFIVKRFNKPEHKAVISDLTGTDISKTENDSDYLKVLSE